MRKDVARASSPRIESARGLEEQSAALLAELRQALDRLRSIEPKEAQAAWQRASVAVNWVMNARWATEGGRA